MPVFLPAEKKYGLDPDFLTELFFLGS